jgi:P4 family phage/plasmid primase-like protien
MTAVGKVYEEGLVISHGPGSNGKSTFFGAWQQALGSYATTISAELLMSHGPGREVIGMAEVRGKRLVITSETEEGAKLSVSVMKRLTSRDPISARALYQNPITFIPTHTLVMHTNFLPSLKSLDNGTRRRIAIAPFTMSLKPDEVIKDFGDKLMKDEGPAILNWIIEGAIRFYKAGMKVTPPDAIARATEEYLNGEDWFSTFLADCCEVGDGYTVMSSALYKVYARHADDNGDYKRANKVFNAELDRRGFARKRVSAGMQVKGIRLAEAAEL